VSEIGNMAYMERMGFWGTGMPFVDCEGFLDRYVSLVNPDQQHLHFPMEKGESFFVANEADIICYNCAKPGHKANVCPEPRRSCEEMNKIKDRLMAVQPRADVRRHRFSGSLRNSLLGWTQTE
jgi:hypothetical protein